MSLLSRHILRSFAAPFGWGVIALTGMLLLNSLAGLIDRLGGKGLPWHVMAEAILLALPALMVLTLPMAVLSATLYAYGQLAADMELVAMYANGISVWRMARPVLMAALCVAAFNFILFDQFVPRSNARYKALLNDVGQKYPTLSLQPRQLNVLANTPYILMADQIDSGDVLRRVTIYDLGTGHQRVIHADSAIMKMSPNETDMLMTLHHGEILEFPGVLQDQDRTQRTSFLSDRFRLRDVTNKLNLRDDPQGDRGDREMSGCELLDGIVDQKYYLKDGATNQAHLTERDLRHLVGLPAAPIPSVQLKPPTQKHCGIYRRGEEWLENQLLSKSAIAAKIADSVRKDQIEQIRLKDLRHSEETELRAKPSTDSLLAVALGTTDTTQHHGADSTTKNGAPPIPQTVPPPVAVAGQQPPTDPILHALPGFADSLPQRLVPTVAGPATTDVVSTWSDVLSARSEIKFARLQTASFEVEYHKKWAIPLASFCFVLLGLALALRNPRGGIGLVIGGSLIIFMVFYILIIGGENMAKKLYLDPVLAMHGPLVVFTLLGLASVAAANREMGSARSGQFLDRFRAIFRRKTRTQ